MHRAKRDAQSPQASASTNSATRAGCVVADGVSQNPGHESSGESTGNKFRRTDFLHAGRADDPGNENQPSRGAFVYGLIDPRTSLVFYVGQTRCGAKRPLHHAACRAGTKALVVEELRRAGLTYEWTVLEHVSDPDGPGSTCWWRASRGLNKLDDAERYWIAYGKATGWPLANDNHGGSGVKGIYLPPDEEFEAEILDQRCDDCRSGQAGEVRWFNRETRSILAHARAGEIAGAYALATAQSIGAWALNLVAADEFRWGHVRQSLTKREREIFEANRIHASPNSKTFAPFSVRDIVGQTLDLNVDHRWDGRSELDATSRRKVMQAARAVQRGLDKYGVVRFCGRSQIHKDWCRMVGVPDSHPESCYSRI